MTAHIAHKRSRCGASHTGVIIHALAPVIGPYMSRAMITIHHQHANMTTRKRTMKEDRACMDSAKL